MSTAVTDRIEKKILMRAPRTKVWRAISTADQFGAWFGATFDGPFTLGATLRGVVQATVVDAEIAKKQKASAGKTFEITIERVEPERTLAFRWHPYAIDEDVDYSTEPTTLIVFALEDAPGGTLVTVTESGFDQIPLGRRATAFTANEQGWGMMIDVLAKYVGGHAGAGA